MYRPIASFAVLFFASTSLSAQWLDYPTPGIPRTEDGKPNLTAPAPKTPDGKPDFSGIWSHVKPGNRSRPVYDISTLVQGGSLPHNAAGAEIYSKRKPFESLERVYEPKTNCWPQGPILDAYDIEIQFVQTPNLLVQLLSFDKRYRMIYLDGRPLEADPEPAWDGYSVGQWEGDTLVIQTYGLNGKTWLDIAGNPISEKARVTERVRRQDFGHMTHEVTVNDPVYYTKPWSVTFDKRLVVDTEMLETICNENNKDLQYLMELREKAEAEASSQ
jgi:hypothetical protein